MRIDLGQRAQGFTAGFVYQQRALKEILNLTRMQMLKLNFQQPSILLGLLDRQKCEQLGRERVMMHGFRDIQVLQIKF